ncbi:MAG: phospholipid-binding lipoprotein MlaA [Hyphomicrobiaceae bacterium]|jgi:phospholipid-binding lipoprotein MlaA
MLAKTQAAIVSLALAAMTLAPPPVVHAAEISDPLEGLNRAVFIFNDKLDRWVLEPVARGWDFVLPDPAQTGFDNFFSNLRFPIDFTNELLQGQPRQAGRDLGRFVVNTTIGIGGFFDHATKFGLEKDKEDFGQTFGVWGVGTGPYLMLPFFGPSSPRDAVGTVLDGFATVWPYFVDRDVVWIPPVVGLVNTRSLYLDEIENARETSLDYYTFVRNLYAQRRAALIADRPQDAVDAEAEDDLYFYDEAAE